MATLAECLEGEQCAFHSKNDKGRVLNIVKAQDGERTVWIPILLDEERRCTYDKWKNVVLGEEIIIADHMVRDLDTLKNVAAEGKYLDWKEGIIQWIEDDPLVVEEVEAEPETVPEDRIEKLTEKVQELFGVLQQLLLEQARKENAIAEQLATLPTMIQEVFQAQKGVITKQEEIQQRIGTIPASVEKVIGTAFAGQQGRLIEITTGVQSVQSQIAQPISQSELGQIEEMVKRVVQEALIEPSRGKLALGRFQPLFGRT